MGEATRRGFITVAGLGTAAGLAVAVAPSTAAATSAESTSLPAGASGAMGAFVHDLEKGEVALMVEGRQVIVTDKVLVSRLAHAFARATHL
jgi:hypothetical protein